MKRSSPASSSRALSTKVTLSKSKRMPSSGISACSRSWKNAGLIMSTSATRTTFISGLRLGGGLRRGRFHGRLRGLGSLFHGLLRGLFRGLGGRRGNRLPRRGLFLPGILCLRRILLAGHLRIRLQLAADVGGQHVLLVRERPCAAPRSSLQIGEGNRPVFFARPQQGNELQSGHVQLGHPAGKGEQRPAAGRR